MSVSEVRYSLSQWVPILAFAVSVEAEGFNLNTIGYILMVVGALGVVLTFVVGHRYHQRAAHRIRQEGRRPRFARSLILPLAGKM